MMTMAIIRTAMMLTILTDTHTDSSAVLRAYSKNYFNRKIIYY